MPIMLGGGGSENLSRCYLGDQLLVGGKCCWSPNSDTYCYCPLESDYADHSGNNIAVTSDLTSFKVNDMFPGGTGKYVCIPQTNIVTAATEWTILYRVYPRNKNNGKVTVLSETTTRESHNFTRGWNNEFGAGANAFPSTGAIGGSGSEGGSYDAWHLFIMRHRSNQYIEGAWDGNAPIAGGQTYGTSVTNYPIWFGRHVVYTSSSYPYGLLGQMRDIIVEKKYRSDEECLSFYNCFKSKFGL